MAVPILLKFGKPSQYKIAQTKRKKFGGHLVFCANLISAVALERLYRPCSNLVHQFIIK